MFRCVCMCVIIVGKENKKARVKFFKEVSIGFYHYINNTKILTCKYEAKKENRTSLHRTSFQCSEIQGCRRFMETNSMTWF